jgi:hypothetical protein
LKVLLPAAQEQRMIWSPLLKYIKTAGLEELMRVNDSGKNIKILVKSGATDSQIKELWCLLKVVVSQTKPFWCHWRVILIWMKFLFW